MNILKYDNTCFIASGDISPSYGIYPRYYIPYLSQMESWFMTWNLGATIVLQIVLLISSTFVEDEVEFKEIGLRISPDH